MTASASCTAHEAPDSSNVQHKNKASSVSSFTRTISSESTCSSTAKSKTSCLSVRFDLGCNSFLPVDTTHDWLPEESWLPTEPMRQLLGDKVDKTTHLNTATISSSNNNEVSTCWLPLHEHFKAKNIPSRLTSARTSRKATLAGMKAVLMEQHRQRQSATVDDPDLLAIIYKGYSNLAADDALRQGRLDAAYAGDGRAPSKVLDRDALDDLPDTIYTQRHSTNRNVTNGNHPGEQYAGLCEIWPTDGYNMASLQNQYCDASQPPMETITVMHPCSSTEVDDNPTNRMARRWSLTGIQSFTPTDNDSSDDNISVLSYESLPESGQTTQQHINHFHSPSATKNKLKLKRLVRRFRNALTSKATS